MTADNPNTFSQNATFVSVEHSGNGTPRMEVEHGVTRGGLHGCGIGQGCFPPVAFEAVLGRPVEVA